MVSAKSFFPSVVVKQGKCSHSFFPQNLWSSSCKYIEVLHFCPVLQHTFTLYLLILLLQSVPSFQLTVTRQKWPWKHLLPLLSWPVKITVEVCRWFISLKNLRWQYFCSPTGNCLQWCICLFCFAQGTNKSAATSSIQLSPCKCSFYFIQALMYRLPSFQRSKTISQPYTYISVFLLPNPKYFNTQCNTKEKKSQ